MVNQFGDPFGGGGSGITGTGILYETVSLLGTISVPIVLQTKGSFSVMITSNVSGGPNMTFQVSKATASSAAQFDNFTSSTSADTNKIGVEWSDGGFLRIGKELASFDGEYTVVVVGS